MMRGGCWPFMSVRAPAVGPRRAAGPILPSARKLAMHDVETIHHRVVLLFGPGEHGLLGVVAEDGVEHGRAPSRDRRKAAQYARSPVATEPGGALKRAARARFSVASRIAEALETRARPNAHQHHRIRDGREDQRSPYRNELEPVRHEAGELEGHEGARPEWPGRDLHDRRPLLNRAGDGVVRLDPVPGNFERRDDREHRKHVEGIAIPHAGTRAWTAVAATLLSTTGAISARQMMSASIELRIGRHCKARTLRNQRPPRIVPMAPVTDTKIHGSACWSMCTCGRTMLITTMLPNASRSDCAQPLKDEHGPAAEARLPSATAPAPTLEGLARAAALEAHAPTSRVRTSTTRQHQAAGEQELGRRQPSDRQAEKTQDCQRDPDDHEDGCVRSLCRKCWQRQHREEREGGNRCRHGHPQARERRRREAAIRSSRTTRAGNASVMNIAGMAMRSPHRSSARSRACDRQRAHREVRRIPRRAEREGRDHRADDRQMVLA